MEEHKTTTWEDLLKIAFWVFLGCLAFAIVRYNYFESVPLRHIPLLITNKAVSFAAVLLFAYGMIQRPLAILGEKEYDAPKARGLMLLASIMAMLHVILALILLDPGYFKKLYAIKRFNEIGELTLFFGALSFALILARYLGAIQIEGLGRLVAEKRTEMLNLFFALAVMAHLFFWGGLAYSHKDWTVWPGGWILPHTWPGMMPPITLLAFLAMAIYCFFWLRARLKKGAPF